MARRVAVCLLAVILAAPFRAETGVFGLRELAEAAWIIKLSGVLGYPIAIIAILCFKMRQAGQRF
jgi:hypothetical protein